MILQNVAPELRRDADLVKEAVMRSGWELLWASRELRNEKHIVAWACMPQMVKQLTMDQIKHFYKNFANNKLLKNDRLLQLGLAEQNVARLQALKPLSATPTFGSTSCGSTSGFGSTSDSDLRRAQEQLQKAEREAKYVPPEMHYTGVEHELFVMEDEMRSILWPGLFE